MTSDPSITNDPPQLQRDLSQKAIAGVASGIAAHLRLPVLWFRVAFVLLVFFNGLGMFLYGVLWGMIPGEDTDTGRGMSLFWPFLLAGVGVVLIWVQADGGGLKTGSLGKRSGSRVRTIASVARLVGGLILVGFGTSWLLASQFGWEGLQTVVAAAVALLAGVAVVMAPWLLRLWSRVRTADRERLRAEARADMAAHLHDSVLQTLALIQRQADDPVRVASLARRQERELRTWLYGEETRAQTLKGAL